MRKPNRPRRPNATGRSEKSPPFTMLLVRLRESAAYASLDLKARELLWELTALYKSDNNGSLYLSIRAAADRLGLSDFHAVQQAFDDLLDRGFIELAKEAHFSVKAADTNRSRCWRLTFHSWPESPNKARRAPTNDWERYAVVGGTRASKRADKRLRALATYRKDIVAGRLPVVETTTTEAKMGKKSVAPVEKITTANPANDANPPFVVVGDSTAHIDVTRGRGSSWWWRSDTEAMIGVQLAMLATLIQNRPKLAKAA